MAELPDLLPFFFFDQEQRGNAKRTIRQRRSDLRDFPVEFPDPRDVTERGLENWLVKKGLEVSSERQVLYSVSEFFKFGIDQGFLTHNPAVGPLAKRPPKQGVRVVMPTEDVERAIEQTSGVVRLWIALSSFQGLACREVADLTVESFDSISNPTLLSHGVTSTKAAPRSTQLHPTVIAAMSAVEFPSSGSIFEGEDPQSISKTINKYFRSAGIRASAKDLVWWYRKQHDERGVNFDRGAGALGAAHYDPTQDEGKLIKALEIQVPRASDSYHQALRDLAAADRVSFRGTVHELRSVLLDVLETLAPESEVIASDGFKFEANQTTPTQAQKARFTLKKRLGRTERLPAENSLERSEELFGRLSRAVYSSGSKSSHEGVSKSDVLQYKRYIDVVLFELLGVQ